MLVFLLDHFENIVLIASEMEMEYLHGKMEIVMKVIILMMNSMEKEHI